MVGKIKELLKYRELIGSLAGRNLKLMYKGSVVGYFWLLLNPLLLTGLFVVVFSVIVRIKVENYPLFLLTGLLPWVFFQSTVAESARSLLDNVSLMKGSYFPREALPLSLVFSKLIHFALSLLVLIPVLLLYRNPPSGTIFFLPFLIILQTMLIAGLALLVSSMNVFFRDVGIVMNFVLTFWFYATPIFYPVSMVPPKFIYLYMLNPMAPIISAYRGMIIGRGMPEAQFLLLSVAISLLMFHLGLKYFREVETAMMKRI